MRSVRLLSVVAATVSIAAGSLATAPGAGAASSGTHTESLGTAFVAESPGTTTSLSGHCTYARSAAGIEGSGVDFHIAGVGTAGGTYQGVPIVATGVECTLYKPEATVTSGPEFLPGPVSETNRTYNSTNAVGGVICVRVHAVLRQPVNGSNYITTNRACH